MDFVAYKPQLDWLTWYSDEWDDIMTMRQEYMRRVCENGGKDRKVKALKRFAGGMIEGVQWGENRQGGVLIGEGSVTHEIEAFCRLTDWSSRAHATRIDIQVSVKQHSRFNPFALLRTIKGIYGSEPYIRTDPDGLATIYIGARESDKFWRIYQKPDIEGNLYTRVEIEVKGEIAKRLWKMGLSDATICGYMAGEFSKLRKRPYADMVLKEVEDVLAGAVKIGVSVEKPVPNSMLWLEQSVTPALIRLMNFNDSKDYVHGIIDGWYKISQGKRGVLK